MNDDSYYMPICIGIGIRISISKIFSSVLAIGGIESIRKGVIGPALKFILHVKLQITSKFGKN